MAAPLIRLHRVCFSYAPARPVFQDLDFVLEPGDRVCLTGPNGSGKSTLLKLILGLARTSRGTIELLGRPCVSESDFKDARRQIGLVFQDSDTQLFCPTVYDDVAFGPLNLGLTREAVRQTVDETLDALGLTTHADRVTYQLSHGEKRLVALATILAMRPKVILLDEPTAGLDASAEARLTDILRRLPQEMLIVSHNRPFIEEISTRNLHLERGQITNEASLANPLRG